MKVVLILYLSPLLSKHFSFLRWDFKIWITDNALSFVTKFAIINITKVKYTAIILNVIAVNFVNYPSNYANVCNKSFVFHEPLSKIRMHRDLMSVLSYSLKYSTNVKFVQSVGCKVSLKQPYMSKASQNCPYLDRCKNVSLQRTLPFGHKLTHLQLDIFGD